MAADGYRSGEETDSTAESRRRSFRKILGAGGLLAGGHVASGAWVTPVVNAVLLPAHASTSPVEGDSEELNSLEDPCFVTVSCTSTLGAIEVRVDGLVVSPTDDVENVMVDMEIAFSGSGSFESFESTSTDSNGRYQGTQNYSSEYPSSVEIRVTLPEYPDAGPAECSVDINDNSDSGAVYSNADFYTSSDDQYFCGRIRD